MQGYRVPLAVTRGARAVGRLVWKTADLNRNTVGLVAFFDYSIARFTKSAPHENFEGTPTAGLDQGNLRASEKDATESDKHICGPIWVSFDDSWADGRNKATSL